MDVKEMKKVLASLGIATLVSAAGVTVPGHVHAGSGWGAKDNGTVGAGGSGWGAKDSGTGGAAGSGWSGHTDGAVSTDEATQEICEEKGETSEECLAAKEAAKQAEEAGDAAEEKTGGSGWGGHK